MYTLVPKHSFRPQKYKKNVMYKNKVDFLGYQCNDGSLSVFSDDGIHFPIPEPVAVGFFRTLTGRHSLRISAHSCATVALYLRLLRFLLISRETVLIYTETCGSFAMSVNEKFFASKAEITYLCSRVKCLYIETQK